MLKVSKILLAATDEQSDAQILQNISTWDSITKVELQGLPISVGDSEIQTYVEIKGLKGSMEVFESFDVDFIVDTAFEDGGFDHAFGSYDVTIVEVRKCDLVYPPVEEWPQSLLKYREIIESEMVEYIQDHAE